MFSTELWQQRRIKRKENTQQAPEDTRGGGWGSQRPKGPIWEGIKILKSGKHFSFKHELNWNIWISQFTWQFRSKCFSPFMLTEGREGLSGFTFYILITLGRNFEYVDVPEVESFFFYLSWPGEQMLVKHFIWFFTSAALNIFVFWLCLLVMIYI